MTGIATETRRMIMSASAAIAAVICGLHFATQYIADVFDNQPALGPPLVQLGDIRLYGFWAIIEWSTRWGDEYPRPFAVAQLTIFSGLLGGVLIFAAGARRRFRIKPFGEGAWASFSDLKAADLRLGARSPQIVRIDRLGGRP